MSALEVIAVPWEKPKWPHTPLIERIKHRIAMVNPAYLPKYEDVYKAFFNHDDFIRFCFNKNKPTYEILTQEYIHKFANYLVETSKQYDKPMTILEVGAGNGRLTHFVQEELQKQGVTDITLIATDSGKNKIPKNFPVETVDYEGALKKYNPTIVISSWMPMGFDMSKAIRNTQSVQEYILIGEPATSGKEKETWKRSVYEKDGFAMKMMKDLMRLQISRTDMPWYDTHDTDTSTGTFSFKRKKIISS